MNKMPNARLRARCASLWRGKDSRRQLQRSKSVNYAVPRPKKRERYGDVKRDAKTMGLRTCSLIGFVNRPLMPLCLLAPSISSCSEEKSGALSGIVQIVTSAVRSNVALTLSRWRSLFAPKNCVEHLPFSLTLMHKTCMLQEHALFRS